MSIFANPVLVKEMRGRIRGTRPVILLTIYLALTGIITLLTYLATVSAMSFGGNLEAGRVVGKTIFLTVMTAALVQVCVITPSLTSGSVAGEKERQSYDLLISTLLSPLQIALGKLTAALAYALLLIVAALPLAAISFMFGGVSGTELVIGIVGLIVTAVQYATIGLFWSTVMRSTLAATIMALGSVLLVLLGVPFLFVIIAALTQGPPTFGAVLYVYAIGAMLCLHPFIALGYTETLLSQGENPFYFQFSVDSNTELWLPSPWLGFVFLSMVITITLLLLSLRMLKPVQYTVPSKRTKQPKTS